ncbi:MAG: hypothetical protein MUO76_02730 [Anaerolineaceae bacterium]|nr:hypothetical protein [Anaerolineaceae bacterium]
MWASLKAREDKNGLPTDYEPLARVSEKIVNWLNFDRGFMNAIFFLEYVQEPVPCVEKDALNTVVMQSLPPDTIINGLKDQVTLYVCSEVVSQSKYETLTYVTATPTVTGTLPPTSTPAPTRTITSTTTFTPTKTTKPSNTPKPSSTSPPASSATTAPTTAPAATTAPTATTALTATATPLIYDDFTSDPTIFNSEIWTTANSAGGTQDWRSAEKSFYQSGSSSGFPNIYSDDACLLGSAEFRIKTSESNNGNFIIGFVDAGVYANINNGIFIESNSTSQVSLSTMAFGTKTSTPFSVCNRSTTWHTYLISWTQNSQDYSIKASVSVDGSAAVSSTTNTPEVRLNLIVGAMGFGACDQSSIEIDFIKVLSESCQ